MTTYDEKIKMAKPISAQAKNIFYLSPGINKIGESKHEAKAEIRRNGDAGWKAMGQKLGIHSFSTKDKYVHIWRNFGEHSKAEFGIKDMKMLNSEHLKSYLEKRVGDEIAYATWQGDRAALSKLGAALGKTEEFEKTLKETREISAELERFTASRAYEDPRDLISELERSEHRLAACIQLEGGARASSVRNIDNRQLVGNNTISVKEKGGYRRDITVSGETYSKLEQIIKENGVFSITYNAYLADIKSASGVTMQDYNASHGLRWNYAQNRMVELAKDGITYEKSLLKVSKELGHHRLDITKHYLK